MNRNQSFSHCLTRISKSCICFFFGLSLSGCDQESASTNNPLARPSERYLLNFDRFEQIRTAQQEIVAGATVTVTSVHSGILARTLTSDVVDHETTETNSTAPQPGLIVAVAASHHQTHGMCDLVVTAGTLIGITEDKVNRQVNDTIQRALVPCNSLKGYDKSTQSPKIRVSQITLEIARAIELYTELEDYPENLTKTLDRIARSIAKGSDFDTNEDGQTSYLELISAPRHLLDRINIDHLYTAVRNEVGQNFVDQDYIQPNIVLILADDIGLGDVSSFWPDSEIDTPNIDSISATGAAFSNFHVYPVCSATRASLLSGQFSRRLRQPGSSGPARSGIPRSQELIPEYLRRAGYRTGAFGKWHLSSREGFKPQQRGFQKWVGFYGWASPYHLAEVSSYQSDYFFDDHSPIRPADGHTTDLFADEALAFIKQAANAPFFVYLSFNAPHTPLWSEQNKVYSGRNDWIKTVESLGIESGTKRDYIALVRHMDDRIGDVLELLDRLDIARDTIVIFASDNGAEILERSTRQPAPGSNANYRGGKGSVHEGGIRVPLAIKWPSTISPGQQIEKYTMVVDVWPTLREAAGILNDAHLPTDPRGGDSLVALLSGEGDLNDEQRPGYFNFAAREMATILYPWKLIKKHDATFLFNLEADPGEDKNLKFAHPKKLIELETLANRYLTE